MRADASTRRDLRPNVNSRRCRPVQMALAACALAAFGGCAVVAPVGEVTPGDSAFDAAGRLSARRGSEGVVAHFSWRHAPTDDRIDVSTPTGQTLARLSGDAAGVRVERPGEPPTAYADWPALTREVFGVAIPVTDLAAWVVGRPAPGAGLGIERDREGRPEVLRQQGWEIVYTYADGAPSSRPSRLFMRYPDAEPIEVRIVIDRMDAVVR